MQRTSHCQLCTTIVMPFPAWTTDTSTVRAAALTQCTADSAESATKDKRAAVIRIQACTTSPSKFVQLRVCRPRSAGIFLCIMTRRKRPATAVEHTPLVHATGDGITRLHLYASHICKWQAAVMPGMPMDTVSNQFVLCAMRHTQHAGCTLACMTPALIACSFKHQYSSCHVLQPNPAL